MNARTHILFAAAFLVLAGVAGLSFVLPASAGSVTNPGRTPYTKMGVYQGVMSVVPDGTNALELGNAGTDIASTGDLYLRPDSAPRDAAKNVRSYLKTIGANQLGSIAVPGELCLGGTCRTTFTSGTGLTGSGNAGFLPRFAVGPTVTQLENSDLCQDSYGRISLYPEGSGTNCAGFGAPTELLSITGFGSLNSSRTQVGVGRTAAAGTEVLFGMENTFTSYPIIVKGAQDGDGMILMKNATQPHRLNIALDPNNYPIMSFEKNSVAIGVPSLTPLTGPTYSTSHAKLDVYNNWANDRGDTGNAIGAYADTAGSAIYAQQNGTGYAGNFKGNVKIAGTIEAGSFMINGISKTSWTVQVCPVGVDSCLGQYLYSDTSGPAAQYCYLAAGAATCADIGGTSPLELR